MASSRCLPLETHALENRPFRTLSWDNGLRQQRADPAMVGRVTDDLEADRVALALDTEEHPQD